MSANNRRQFRLTRSTMGLSDPDNECDAEQTNVAPATSYTSSLGIVIAPCSTPKQINISSGTVAAATATKAGCSCDNAHGCACRGVVSDTGGGGGGAVLSDDNNEAVNSNYSTTEILLQRRVRSVSYESTMQPGSSPIESETCLCESTKPVNQCIASTEAMPTAHYRDQLAKYRNEIASSGCDASQINFELNSIFLKRLEDIDCQTEDDLRLRLVTYQEWVDLLLHINSVIFGNINQLEVETTTRIRDCFCRINCNQEQELDENRKLRKDICTLVKIIQSAYHKNCWNFKDVNFETLSVQQVLGIPRNQCPENRDGGNTDQHMKALACEVAQKFDEIRLLRSQIICLESDIQTAHQKIILKDKTIAGLREKLEQLEEELDQQQNKMLTNDACCKVTARHHSASTGLTSIDCELHQILDEEFEHNCEHKYRNLETQRQRLIGLFHRISDDRDRAYNKLNCLRNQLNDLGCDQSVMQNVSCQKANANEMDCDERLVAQISKRLNCLNEAHKEASLKCQKLEIQLNDLQANYNSVKCVKDTSCRVLKELAAVICEVTGRAVTYDESFSVAEKINPFSEAFLELHNQCEIKEINTSQLHNMQKKDLKASAAATKTSPRARKAAK